MLNLPQIFTLILLLALSACSNIKDTAEPPAALTAITPTVSIKQVWHRNAGAGAGLAELQLGADAENVYVANDNGKLNAYQIATGKKLWQQNLNTQLSASFAVDDQHLYLSTYSGAVLALAKSTGKRVWTSQLKSQVLAQPALADNLLILQANDGVIYALNTATGKLQWQNKRQPPVLSIRGNSAPVVIGSQVWVGMDNGRLLALNLHDGRVVFENAIGIAHGKTELERLTDIDAPLLVHSGVIYLSAYNNGTVAVDAYNGKNIWSRQQIFGNSGASFYDNPILMLDSNSQLWRLNAQNGSTLWLQNKLRARWLNFPTLVANQYIVAGDFEGYVHVFDAQTGQILARKRFGKDAFVSRFVVADDKILIINKDSQLYAITINPLGK